MTHPVPARRSWFWTITRPASRLVFTTLALVAFFTGIALGVAFPAHQLWFQLPAVVILITWFLVMSLLHRRAQIRH